MSVVKDPLSDYTDRRRMKLIGVGNLLRRDDSAGLVVADKLAAAIGDQISIETCNGEGIDLINHFRDLSAVILVDAVHSGAPPGTVHQIDATTETVPTSFFSYSTHAFGVAEAIELARILGKLPDDVVIFGIEGSDFSPGEGLTTAVEAASDRVVESLRNLLEEPRFRRQN
jgi:hydrogenase maturation protease